MMARALEIIGERWSLLVVRDLLLGPRRFTDLARRLADITPKRLTDRLRQLEVAGLVTREPPGRGREVWYRLTDAGLDLSPVVEALTLWGMNHALEPPQAREPVHPTPLMIGTKVFLREHAGRLPHPTTWVWRFPPDDAYTIRFLDDAWTLAHGGSEVADLVIETTPDAWASFLTARGARTLPRREVKLAGKAAAISLFARAFAAQLRSS